MEKRIKNLEKRMSRVERKLNLTTYNRGVEVICTHCKWGTVTKSKLETITCSNCRNKTKNTSLKDED